MRRALLAGVLLVVGTGCASQVELTTPLDPQEYATCPGRGVNVITGSTFGKTAGGDVISAAGRIVHLDKMTKYAFATYSAIDKKQNKDGAFAAQNESDTVMMDRTMFKCRRNATVGPDGNFHFNDVATGEYFVSTYMSRMNKTGQWSGIWNVTRISVRDGQPLEPLVLYGFHQS